MRTLKICLWITGILCLLSAIGVFLPISVWEPIAKVFGVELELPDLPVIEYMVRLMLATYAGVGVFFIILALNPLKYGVMVPFSGAAAVVLGAVCAVTGSIVAIPARWFLSDSIPCVVLGFLIVVLWQRVKAKN